MRVATTAPCPARSVKRPDCSMSTPILITPTEIWARAVAGPRASSAASRIAMRISIFWDSFRKLKARKAEGLYPKVFVELAHARLEGGVGNHVHHSPVLHDAVPVRHRGREAEVLLDEKDGEALGAQAPDGGPDLLHDDGGQALCRLVEEEQARARAQDATDGEHLLLAPRELGALAAEPLLEIREETEDAVEGKPARADLRGEQKVLLDVEAREDSPLLGAECEAEARNAVRGQGHELVPVEADRALSPRHHAHDGFERGGLAGAVAPEQRHHLPRPHLEADAVQDVRLAIPGVEVPHLEQRALRHGRSPCTPG